MADLPERLLAYVNHGREERNLEYKERLEWQPRHAQGRASLTDDQTTVVKSVMALSNTHLGGVLVIGVRNADGEPIGLPRETAEQFTQDGVAAVVNEYAAPYCELTVSVGSLPDDPAKWFVFVEVQEFATQPVICKRDGRGLEAGSVYIRGRRIYETAKVRSEAEMRELIDLAVEKRVDEQVESFRARLERLVGRVEPAPAPDRERYDAERGPL